MYVDRFVYLVVLLLVSLAPASLRSAAPEVKGHPQLNMVLFVPADVDPPAGVQRRFTEIAQYTESFLVGEMAKDGYPPANEQFLPRDEKGNYQFLFIRGEHPVDSGKYDQPGFHLEVINKAVQKYKLGRDRHVWWIWVYLGDPPKRFSNYRGAGNSIEGGWSMCNYTNLPGEINPQIALAAGFNQEFTLKACIHEMGHAFGLPHLGPMKRDRRGNTLMGPQSKIYASKVDPRDKAVYLCDVSAAMLWKHPVFSGSIDKRGQMPKFQMTSCEGKFQRSGQFLEITGQIETDIPAHSVVVIDESPQNDGGYFRKSFAGRVDQDGNFRVKVEELDHQQGNLQILFCFENGICTGDGKSQGDKSGLLRGYQVTNRGVELSGSAN
ncbi:hypothetical protein GC197_03650 [bacterium]|nr:hypothetical protein [bacterium]